jgi:hypothetical protein
MISKRLWPWTVAALAFSALVLPFLVHLTGTRTLGAYASGGALQFLADYYGSLVRFEPAAWILLLGPVILVLAWRGLVAYARKGTDS